MAVQQKPTQQGYGAIIKLIFENLWSCGAGLRIRLLLALILIIATMALNLGIPILFQKVINALSICTRETGWIPLALLIAYGLSWTLSKITLQMREIVLAPLLSRGIRNIMTQLFNHLHQLSARFHADRKTGAIASIISRVQRALPDIIMELFVFLIPPIIEIFIAVGILWYYYSITYGFMLLCILLLYVVLSVIGVSWLSKSQVIANQKEERLATRLVDSLLNFETIKYFNSQEFERQEFDKSATELEKALTAKEVRSETVHVLQGAMIGLGLTVLTWVSGNEVLNGTMTVGDFVLINGYLIQFFQPLSYFGIILRHIRRGFTDMQHALALLDIKPEVLDIPEAQEIHPDHVTIEFKDVWFGYQAARPILKGVSFSIPAGKTVAVVGPTGSGKSTIAKLLFRLYDVTGGEIDVNKKNIKNVTQESLHALLGIVPQDTVLFNNTLKYNIAYGKPGASDQEIAHAVQMAHLEKLIDSMPQGLSTMVGERGLKLSGGEKQRVAIARALVKNPRVYIFDEATSALDTKTERDIQKNIDEISHDENTTSLIIAHRLSTIVNADTIIVLDHGNVVESGSHDELLKTGGVYKRLWDQQQGSQE